MNFFKYKNGRISKLTKKLFRRIKNYARKARGYFIFTSWKDKKIFYNLSHGKINGNEVFSLNVKTAGKYPVFLRNNIADAGGACSAFFMHYHLPPKKLRPGAVIADLGSNIGLTMRNLKYLYPDSRIIGVEMDHENYLLAKKNLNGLDNCVLINAAIWYKDGFVSYTGADSQSFYCKDVDAKFSEKVRACSLPTLLSEHNLQVIDFVKMDIEGAESIIFDNDCSWLNAVQSINVEVHNGEPLTKYISVLKQYGFTCKRSKKHWSAVLAYK